MPELLWSELSFELGFDLADGCADLPCGGVAPFGEVYAFGALVVGIVLAGEVSELLELAGEPDWTQAMREGARRYLRWWQERPTISSAYLVSLPTVGAPALRQRERHYAAFRAMFADLGRRARVEQPELGPLSDLIPRVLVVAITELVAEEVRAGRTSQLTDLSDEIAFLAIRLLADDATAEGAAVKGAKVGS